MGGIEEELSVDHFRVVIYGSARIKEGTREYQRIYDLAKMIGEENIDVVTGGGPGLMEAAMSGHFAGKKGGDSHEIGLQIKLPHEQRDSKHFDVKEEFSRFSARLDTFMTLADVVVVAPGGVGTSLEFFYTWQLIQVKHSCRIPIILLGKMWADLLKWVERWPLKYRDLDPEDLDMIIPVRNINEAMDVIRLAHKEYDEHRDTYCSNMQKYKIR